MAGPPCPGGAGRARAGRPASSRRPARRAPAAAASLAGTGLLAREEYEDRADLAAADPVPLAIVAAVTLVRWAVRSSTSVARLCVEGGQLSITRNGETWRCDLASRATPVEVVGQPGRRGWKVVFGRQGRARYVADSSMVDPSHVTRVLAHYRPDVVDRP